MKKLGEALRKNEQVAEEVKEAADDLAVVHAVLDTKLPADAKAGDVATAVTKAEQIEKRLTESGKMLDKVNEALRESDQTGDSRSANPPREPRAPRQ